MVYQSFEDDCGKAVVRNVLCLLEKNDSFSTILLKSDCRSFYDIKEELSSFDAEYKAYEVASLDKIEERHLPSILLFNQDGKKHFVILKKKSKRKCTILDPNFGEYDLTYEEFYSFYLGKALLKQSFKKLKMTKVASLLKKKEKISYFLCFLFQISLTCLSIFLAGMEHGAIYCALAMIGIGIMILFQNILNGMVAKRLDEEIAIPYMRDSKKDTDFRPLHTLIREKIKKTSNCVSYGSICLILIFLYALNSHYLSFLCLVPFVFFVLRFPLKKERNKIDLLCSLEESQYLRLLKKDAMEAEKHFKEAKRISRLFAFRIIFSYVVEALNDFLLIIMALYTKNSVNINQVFFYFGLSLSMTYSLAKLYESLFDKKEEIRQQNRLSLQLESFLLKTKTELKYNSKDKGDSFNERSKAYPRIPRSDESKEEDETDLHARL